MFPPATVWELRVYFHAWNDSFWSFLVTPLSAGCLLGPSHWVASWTGQDDPRVCLWKWQLWGPFQLPLHHLWHSLPLLCTDPLCTFCHHHPGSLLHDQAHSWCTCEYYCSPAPHEMEHNATTSLYLVCSLSTLQPPPAYSSCKKAKEIISIYLSQILSGSS